MKQLFITGPYRSGTTLLEKLLHNHKDICVASQPFPYLYHATKKLFLDSRHLARRYPLDHLFLEDQYRPADFTSFLETCKLSQEFVARALSDMAGYSGQYMPEFLDYCRSRPVAPSPLFSIHSQLLSLLPVYLDRSDGLYVGSKESFCEEYVPLFLAHGVKVLIILRDPRDVITSLSYGQGAKFGGEARPTLFIMRQWRKSASFCMAFDGHPDFLYITYEDLAQHPWDTLDRVTAFLQVPAFDPEHFVEGIRNQDGSLWRGNSSFSGRTFISLDSVGTFKTKLPETTLRYIESICYPELVSLGYDPYQIIAKPDEEAIRDFREPFEVTHHAFEADYSIKLEHVQEEIERLRRFSDELDIEQQAHWFIFPDAYQNMKGKIEHATDTQQT